MKSAYCRNSGMWTKPSNARLLQTQSLVSRDGVTDVKKSSNTDFFQTDLSGLEISQMPTGNVLLFG